MIFLKAEIFLIIPTRHMKNKMIHFAPSNIAITALTNLERFLRRIKSPLTR